MTQMGTESFLITTYAGTGDAGYSGDGGPATLADIGSPYSVATDQTGNIYFTDYNNHVVRKVDANTGVISRVAGLVSSFGYSGDGGPAIVAELYQPTTVASDSGGNLFIADRGNHVIRRIDASTGIITTVAGSGVQGYTGDGGPASLAQLSRPYGVAVDREDNLLFSDYGNYVIRRVDSATGVITTIAGTGDRGYSGDGGPATAAQLKSPCGLALDAVGNLFIADSSNYVIRRIDAVTGIITTVAGRGVSGGDLGDGGPAIDTAFSRPIDVALDVAGNLFIADFLSRRVRKVDQAGIITTIAGTGFEGYTGDGGPASLAQLNQPYGVAVDKEGNLYIADFYAHVIRKVSAKGQEGTPPVAPTYTSPSNDAAGVTRNPVLQWETVAGADSYDLYFGEGNTANLPLKQANITGTSVSLSNLSDGIQYFWKVVAKNAYGDSSATSPVWSFTVTTCTWLVSPANAEFSSEGGAGSISVSTQAGCPWTALSNSGWISVTSGSLGSSSGTVNYRVAISDDIVPRTGSMTIAETVVTVSQSDAGHLITTIAGTGKRGYSGDDGPATEAQLYQPYEAVGYAGDLYIADKANNVIRKVNGSTGIISTIAGTGVHGYSGDNGPATQATFSVPSDIAIDTQGSLFITDLQNRVVRKIQLSTGIITTYAGTGDDANSGDSGQAIDAAFRWPTGLAVDSKDNLYIADFIAGRVRKVDAITGVITTFAGDGNSSSIIDGRLAIKTSFSAPTDVEVDATDNIYVAILNGDKIIKIDAITHLVSTVAGNGIAGYTGDGGLATSASLYNPRDIAIDAAGNLFIADYDNSVIRRVDVVTHEIHTVAGTGSQGYSGDGGPATLAELTRPQGVNFDAEGNLLIADTGNNVIRKVHGIGQNSSSSGTSIMSAFTNAASYYQGALAPDEIVTLWGTDMADSLLLADSVPLPTHLGGASVTFTDSAGAQHEAGLLYVSATQTSLVMPSGMAHGPATASITTPSGTDSMAVQIAGTAPGIFAANENGQGAPAGTALLVKPDNSRTSQFLFNDGAPAGGRDPVPVNMGNEGDQVYLILYGTGIRWNLPKVTATVDGLSVGAVAVAHPVFVGLDQINIGPLPRTLLGRGNVEVALTVDGVAANPVTINIP